MVAGCRHSILAHTVSWCNVKDLKATYISPPWSARKWEEDTVPEHVLRHSTCGSLGVGRQVLFGIDAFPAVLFIFRFPFPPHLCIFHWEIEIVGRHESAIVSLSIVETASKRNT